VGFVGTMTVKTDMTEAARAPGAAEPARTFDFSRGQGGQALLGEGWWGPEPWGVWSSGRDASIRLAGLQDPASDVALTLELRLPPRRPGGRGQVSIRVNGDLVFTVVELPAGPARIMKVVAPGAIWSRADPAIVSIHCDDAFNAKRDAGRVDSRDIAVGLIRLAIESVPVRSAPQDDPLAVRQMLDALPEAIRLVVWDPEATLWRGTATQGGAHSVAGASAIVAELAARGIVSSICAKGDADSVRVALEAAGLLETVVFPQVERLPVGARLAKIVDLFQLRPQSVLFVSDDPGDRVEAGRAVPGLRAVGPGAVAHLLAHARFEGEPDPRLRRVARARQVATRRAAQAEASDPIGFLRRSNIRVRIELDLESHIDRAIALVERTDGLNFTRRRLPGDDAEAVARQFLVLTRGHDIQAGLVRVEDDYGDYGIVGLYVLRQSVRQGTGLLHYCFSSRTLGLRLETWLFRRLGRPPIDVRGEVAADLFDDGVIDWIGETAIEDGKSGIAIATGDRDAMPAILLRGGEEMMAVGHYCRQLTGEMGGEYPFTRDRIEIRTDHSIMLRHAIEALSAPCREAALRLGFRDEDFRTRLLDDRDSASIRVFSFWNDAALRLYRHKTLGMVVPFEAFPAVLSIPDLTQSTLETLRPQFHAHWIADALEELKVNYELLGTISESQFKENLTLSLGRIPKGAPVFVVGCNARVRWPSMKEFVTLAGQAAVNQWCRELCAAAGLRFIEPDEFIREESDVDPIRPNQFGRLVYFRICAIVAREARARPAAAGPAL